MGLIGDDYRYFKLQCEKCGRKTLVELFVDGVSDIHLPNATCADCLGEPEDGYASENPDAVKDILEWARE